MINVVVILPHWDHKCLSGLPRLKDLVPELLIEQRLEQRKNINTLADYSIGSVISKAPNSGMT